MEQRNYFVLKITTIKSIVWTQELFALELKGTRAITQKVMNLLITLFLETPCSFETTPCFYSIMTIHLLPPYLSAFMYIPVHICYPQFDVKWPVFRPDFYLHATGSLFISHLSPSMTDACSRPGLNTKN